MSFNQSRPDRSEAQYRKSGRSAGFDQQRTSSGSYGKGAGGGPAPSPSVNSSSSLPASNRSLKKTHNAQGSQSRVNVPDVNSSGSANNASAHRNLQNGAHSPPQFHGASDVPIGGSAAKQVEPPAPHRSTRAVPKAPSSQSASMSLDSTAPATQAKGDPSETFHFQFGSIGMQIPARTSSAPPNLDEQKRDQAHHETYISVPNIPTPSVPKQQLPRKDVGAPDQSSTGEVHQVPKVKKDPQASLPPTTSQTQKSSVFPIPMTSMQMPFHQAQVSVQFGGHNPQIQPQNVAATSHPISMHMSMQLPMGNAPQVQQHMFVPGLQPHPMQPQGFIHQGQGMGFTTQIGPPQLTPQLGNMGMGINPQYPQLQGGKFGGGTRKTVVKITHPDTHKEVKLDERADTYSDGGVSVPRSQSQQVPSFSPAHPINYYPNSYGASAIYYPVPGSLPLTSNQLTPNTQATRFNSTVGQGPQNVSFMNPNLNLLPVSKAGTPMPGVAEPPNTEQSRDTHNFVSSASSGNVQVTVKPASGSVGEKTADSSLSDISPAVGKVGTPKPSRPFGEDTASHPPRNSETVPEKSSRQVKPSSELSLSKELAGATNQCAAVSSAVSTESVGSNSLPIAPSEESVDSVPITNVEGKRTESLSRSNSIKDQQKKMGKKGQIQTQQQVGGQSSTASSLACRTAETCILSTSGVYETTEAKTTSESLSASDASTSEISEAKAYSTKQSITFVSSEISGTGNGANILGNVCDAKSKLAEPSPPESSGTETEVRGGEALPERFKLDINASDISSQSANSKSPELVSQTDQKSALKATAICNEVSILGTIEGGLGESARTATEADKLADTMDVSTSGIVDSTDVESSHGNKTSTVDALSSRSDVIRQQSALSSPEFPETNPKNESEFRDNSVDGSLLLPVASPKETPVVELNTSKGPLAKGKKKRKEILQKADAAGTTSDLYMAYKGPEEKRETVPSESAESTPTVWNSKEASADALHVDATAIEKSVQSKSEPDDWEDAADISTPKLEPSDVREQPPGVHHVEDGNVGKKYSRDFLLMFAEQCTNLPEGFEIATDIAEALISDNINVSHIVERDSYPSPGRVIDRQSGGFRADRRGSVMVDDDRWGRLTGPSLGRDLRLDVGYGANAGFRPGQGVNYGALRNPRAQISMQYPGAILPGPMQSMGPQGGMQRSSPDVDRWQRFATFQQRGLIPSPQTPLQMMHKADRKYEVGKVQDEEEAKQRQLKAILNKLTPQNFEKLFEQVKAVNIDNTVTLNGVISQIFDKALMEPTFCEMYANFCSYLVKELPDFSGDNEKITFKRLLLNKCQDEFERGKREQEEANKTDNEGEIKQTEVEREEKRIKARRRMLGNIRLIGELYKKKMLTESIMHGCIMQLLGEYENPDEEDVEALCKLMSTIGEMIDHRGAKEKIDAYFDRMAKLSNNMKLSSRVRFMLKDAIELRKNKWQQRRKVEGPKKIEEVHRDAAQERQAQSSRLARGSSMNSSTRRVPMDFGPRGLSSPTNQMGSFRGMPTQNRGGYGAQDARFEDRQSYEARTLSVSLPQRPRGGDSITLGPQGGLARGMSIRGPPTTASTLLPDVSPGAGEPRRMTTGFNGFSTSLERPAYGSREDIIPSYHPDRFVAPPAFDQLSSQECKTNYGNRDVSTPERSLDRPLATSARGQAPAVAQNVPSENMWPEDRLQDLSMAAIREFYSARDEKEVALCIKDLNSPGFHPSMVSLWVIDSFEKKDIERDSLANLLVNLSKSRDGMLSPGQLIKGFESVLTTLEEVMTDAPKAAEFLGRIFAKVVEENVIPLREIGRLLLSEGREEAKRLRDTGLAGDVLGSTLENIKSDKGEKMLHEIQMSSNLRLEDFRPLDPNRSSILGKFI